MNLGGTENVILQLCDALKPKVNKIVVCSCGGLNVEKLSGMGIKHYKIPDIADKKPEAIFFAYHTVNKIIKDENITVIHSHHRMAALLARFVGGKKLIRLANAHNTFHDKKIFTRIAYKGTKIITVGEQVKKNLADFYGLPSTQITVIHNAIKPFTDSIEPIEELLDGKKNAFTLIGNIGRLTEQKGMEYFIQAAVDVHKEYPMARFFIVGDGEDAEKLKKMTNELLPLDVLSFLGYRSDIQNIMSQLDFIVLSSLWEGLPLTPIEAFSVGKTVVATAVDGTPEIVKDRENGLLVDPKDVEGLVKKMLFLCNNINIRNKYEKSAKETYNNVFSFDKFKDKYLTYYSDL
jgi:glycosyltransferase involved in cell wall biosynthesis